MSEDHLERAVQEMKEEDVDAGTLEAARARVWENVNAGNANCAEFRQDFRAYLGNELGGSRRILVEDHLSRCPGCRARDRRDEGRAAGRRHATCGPPPAGCNGEPWPRQPRCSSRPSISDATPSTP